MEIKMESVKPKFTSSSSIITFVAEGDSSDMGKVVMMEEENNHSRNKVSAVYAKLYNDKQFSLYSNTHFRQGLTTIMGVGHEGKLYQKNQPEEVNIKVLL